MKRAAKIVTVIMIVAGFNPVVALGSELVTPRFQLGPWLYLLETDKPAKLESRLSFKEDRQYTYHLGLFQYQNPRPSVISEKLEYVYEKGMFMYQAVPSRHAH